MNRQRTYGYLRDALEGAILRLEDAEGYAIRDPEIVDVVAHVRGSLVYARNALEMAPAVITQSKEEAKHE